MLVCFMRTHRKHSSSHSVAVLNTVISCVSVVVWLLYSTLNRDTVLDVEIDAPLDQINDGDGKRFVK